MSNWLKMLLGIAVSAGIFIGIWAWVYDMHPLRDNSIYTQREACIEQSRYSGGGSAGCYDRYRSLEQTTETQEKWLGAGLGAAAAGLFWLLVYIFYLKPRRRRAQDGSPPPAG
jgi:hypothetical protein